MNGCESFSCYMPHITLTTCLALFHCLVQTAVMTRTPELHTVLVRPGPKLTPMETLYSVFARATVVENGSVTDILLPMHHLPLVRVHHGWKILISVIALFHYNSPRFIL